jgi:murein tripeptide amidase MpaA
MTGLNPNKYYLYDELTAYLKRVADEFPDRARLFSIGESPEGRQIWMVALTDHTTGAHQNRPAYWIDGNTHASEVMGSAACLVTIDHVLTNWETPQIAELMHDRTIYVAPRINPDGAEYVLEKNHYVRSVRRKWPEPEPVLGLEPQDINGDNEVLQMRIEAPDGAWKTSSKDPRVMLPRMPWDTDGPFYHIYAEGLFDEDALRDPRRPMMAGDSHALDFNRNFPSRWEPEGTQYGAGPYPLSEPETKAVVDFLLSHKNVGAMMTYHTYSGVLLRPFGDKPDTKMPNYDLAAYKLFGKRCEELTGFACVSTFHDFLYDPNKPVVGVFEEWAYENYGAFAYTMELWCPWDKAGLDFKGNWLGFWRDRTEEDELALIAWSDKDLGGDGFADWVEFEHPQLGKIELGGWRWLYSFRNCPARMLKDETLPSVLFTLDHASALPRPRLDVRVESAGDETRVVATLQNLGYFPTNITDLAVKNNLVGSPLLEVELGEGVELKEGKLRQKAQHLSGYSQMTSATLSSQHFSGRTRNDVADYVWRVKGEGALVVRWKGDRIGVLEKLVEI